MKIDSDRWHWTILAGKSEFSHVSLTVSKYDVPGAHKDKDVYGC